MAITEKKYRGLVIQQVTQKNGPNIYIIKTNTGAMLEQSSNSWAKAQAAIDEQLDKQRGFYHD